MSLSPSATAARKRRRVEGDAIDLSLSPPQLLSPAAVLSPASAPAEQAQPQHESKAELKRKVAAKQAGALFLGAGEEEREASPSPSLFTTPSPITASPIVLSPSPTPSPSTSSSSGRPQRAAKQEAIARVQAFSVSLNDNREVSAAESKAAAAAAAAARNATATSSVYKQRPSRSSGNRKSRSSSSSRRSHQKKVVSSAAMEADDDDTDSVQIIEKESSATAVGIKEEEEEGVEAEEEGPNEADMLDEEEEVEPVRAKPVHGKRPQQASSQGKRAGTTPANSSSATKPGYKSATKHQTGAHASSSSASSMPKSSASSVASASSSSSAAPSSSRTSHPRASSSSSGPSPSTYYTHLSIAGMPDKRERDRRRDKRVSGFGAWKVVHKSHIPAMTYWGYEDLATETLEEETLDAIRRSRVYEPAGVEPYHRPPWDIIYGITEPPLTLFRRVDTKYGREEYKVKAQRHIEAKEVVAFLGGRLMEQTKADKQQLDEWNQHFHMNKSWLHEFFEYQGSHNLVISTKGHSCIARYIRSPEERVDDDEEGPNVKTDVVLDPKGGLFFVIYYALTPIRRGAELFCMPFLGEWQTRCHREMFLYSRVSHWHHKWAMRLERTLLDAGVQFDTTRPEDIQPRILTPEQEEKFLTIPGFDQGVLPDPLPLDQSMVVIPMDSAMEYAACEYSPQAKLVEISPGTQHCIDAVGTFIPDYLDIKNPLWNEAAVTSTAKTSNKSSSTTTTSANDMAVVEEIVEVGGMGEEKEGEAKVAAAASSSSSSSLPSTTPSLLPSPPSTPSSSPAPSPTTNPRAIVLGETIRIRVDKAAVLDLIHKGYREDLVELREDFGIHSPVRHFTPPCYRAFCVVATAHIPMGTFVFCYAGQITEAVVNRDSAYVYTMEQEQIRRTVRSYHGPDLFLDAMKVGNISRFVNDSMYRSGEAEGKGATANVETQFLFYKPAPDAPGTLHLGFYTTKDVSPGQELVSQYGEEYWKTINKQLIHEHKKYFDYINPYTRKLERLAIKHQLPLPSPPPEQWSVPGEELFEPKPLPYPPLEEKKEDSAAEQEEDEGFEVERILNAKVGEDGQKWYYVKWKHHSSAHNEWIPQRNILDCQQLIAEFEESERSKRGGGGGSSKANQNKSNKNNSKSGGASTKSTSHKKK